MPSRDTFERYLVEEFYDDYREGLINRRVFTRCVAFIAGSMTVTAEVMAAVGCAPEELSDASEPMPIPEGFRAKKVPGSIAATRWDCSTHP